MKTNTTIYTEEKKGEDNVSEIQKNVIVQKGDIFQLGEHRLMCGDSTSIEDVEKLMNGEKADLGSNDPPYGMKLENKGIINDNLNYNTLLEFNKKWINIQLKYLKDNGSFYCWGTDEPLMDIYSNIIKPLIKDQKVTFRNLITWYKGGGQGQSFKGFRSYPIADEKCLFVMCGVLGFNDNLNNYFEGWEPIRKYLFQEKKKLELTNKQLTQHLNSNQRHYWTKSQWSFPTREHYIKLQELGKANNSNAFKKEYDELKKEYDELKKEFYKTRAYFNNIHDNQNNVWHFGRTSNKERKTAGGHYTPKPIDLCSRILKSSSKENGLVLDFFGGSGSTLISCEKTKRKCYMMELDEKYIQVILKRYNTYTEGHKEIKCLNRALDLKSNFD